MTCCIEESISPRDGRLRKSGVLKAVDLGDVKA